MKTYRFTYSSILNANPNEIFKWHQDKDALIKLTPKNLIEITKYSTISEGNELHFKIKFMFGLFKINWIAKIVDVIKGREFSDLQIKGPFKYWYHRHLFIETSNRDECLMKDQIDFLLPGGRIINFLLRIFVVRNLKTMFEKRHSALKHSLMYSSSK